MVKERYEDSVNLRLFFGMELSVKQGLSKHTHELMSN